MASIWLTLTENNLSEGGRPRDPRVHPELRDVPIWGGR